MYIHAIFPPCIRVLLNVPMKSGITPFLENCMFAVLRLIHSKRRNSNFFMATLRLIFFFGVDGEADQIQIQKFNMPTEEFFKIQQ
jgi:hypothetical protein